MKHWKRARYFVVGSVWALMAVASIGGAVEFPTSNFNLLYAGVTTCVAAGYFITGIMKW